MKTLAYFALSSLICFQALAACTSGEDIDLRKVHASVLNNIAVKNQGNYGLCYAYAGAAITDFYRMKSGGTKSSEISPIEAALLSAIYAKNDSEEGGDICDVVNSLSHRGVACPAYAIRRESLYKDVGLYFHREIVNQVFMPFLLKEVIFKSVPRKNFQSRQSLSLVQKSYLARFDTFYKALKAELLKRGIYATEIPAAIDVFVFAQKAHAENKYILLSPSFTQSLIAKACAESSIAVPQLKCETKEIARSLMISELDHQLDNFKNPVGISYCSAVLNNKNAAGIDYYNKPRKTCLPHASVVIGKRFAGNGKCDYLIRNSWGKDHKYPWPTSGGDIWVSESAMMMNVYKVHVTE